MESKKFVEREWNEGIEGELDEDGFFYTPNGSFWDPDYVYFNREGFDRHGGYYDDEMEYIPGEGWDEINMCYLDELENDEGDELYHSNKGKHKQSSDFEGDVFEYEGEDDDDILEGETPDFVNDPDIETIQIPVNHKRDNINRKHGNNNNNIHNKKWNKNNQFENNQQNSEENFPAPIQNKVIMKNENKPIDRVNQTNDIIKTTNMTIQPQNNCGQNKFTQPNNLKNHNMINDMNFNPNINSKMMDPNFPMKNPGLINTNEQKIPQQNFNNINVNINNNYNQNRIHPYSLDLNKPQHAQPPQQPIYIPNNNFSYPDNNFNGNNQNRNFQNKTNFYANNDDNRRVYNNMNNLNTNKGNYQNRQNKGMYYNKPNNQNNFQNLQQHNQINQYNTNPQLNQMMMMQMMQPQNFNQLPPQQQQMLMYFYMQQNQMMNLQNMQIMNQHNEG